MSHGIDFIQLSSGVLVIIRPEGIGNSVVDTQRGQSPAGQVDLGLNNMTARNHEPEQRERRREHEGGEAGAAAEPVAAGGDGGGRQRRQRLVVADVLRVVGRPQLRRRQPR